MLILICDDTAYILLWTYLCYLRLCGRAQPPFIAYFSNEVFIILDVRMAEAAIFFLDNTRNKREGLV